MLGPMAVWTGVDVGGLRKGFDVAVIGDGHVVALLSHQTCQQVVDCVLRSRPAAIGIDSPRSCAPAGHTARECEIRLARRVCGIRWTPDERSVRANPYYGWVTHGLELFRALAAHGVQAIEVFPTASWTRWRGSRGMQTRAAWTRQGLAALGLAGVPARTSQDQRDALAAAVTARQHTLAQTETIGEIVIPVVRPGTQRLAAGPRHPARQR